MIRTLSLAAAALLAIVAGSTALSSGTFTATSSNPSTFSAAASFPSSCTPGTTSATADIDTTISDNGDSSDADAETLTVGFAPAKGGSWSEALVRFPLPALPSGCSPAGATLRMTASASKDRTLDVHQATAPWSESAVWPGPTVGAVLDGVDAATGPISWDVSAAVVAVYGGGANHGFVIKDANPDDATGNQTQTFHSSEAATASDRPTLVVTYQ